MKKNTNHNALAIAIGFALIILIAGIALLRFDRSEKNLDASTDAAQNAITENIRKATKLSATDLLKQMMDPQSDLTIIDVRSATDFTEEHLLDSHNAPAPTILDAMMALNKDKHYVIVDYGPSVVSTASIIKVLTEAGFNNLSYLTGGFSTWKESYNPVIFEGDPNSFVDQSKVSYIQSDKLYELLQTNIDLTIIDVRRNNQFQEGHIAGAINIFLDDIEKNKDTVPSGKKIVLYDNDGLWAFKAAVRLFDMGFFNTLTLSDGLDGWKNKGYELVK